MDWTGDKEVAKLTETKNFVIENKNYVFNIGGSFIGGPCFRGFETSQKYILKVLEQNYKSFRAVRT